MPKITGTIKGQALSALHSQNGHYADNIPQELRDLPSWANWKHEVTNGKASKPPYNPKTGKYANLKDLSTVVPFSVAWAERKRYAGISFLLQLRFGIIGVDLDNCRNPKTGAIEGWALKIVTLLSSYTELSPSGTGLRIFVYGWILDNRTKSVSNGKLEIYAARKFLTVTGNVLLNCPREIHSRHSELDAIFAEHFSDETDSPLAQDGILGDWTPDNASITDENLSMLFRRFKQAKLLFDGDGNDDDSSREQGLANYAAVALSPADVASVLVESRKRLDKEPKHPGYYELTVATALASNLVAEFGAGGTGKRNGQPQKPQKESPSNGKVQATDDAAAQQEAERMSRSPNLMDEIASDIETVGVIGERELGQTVYVIGTSRITDDPLHGIVQGDSSSGKSFLVGTIALLIPEEERMNVMSMTRMALVYMEAGALRHKFIEFGERSRQVDDEAADKTALVRQFRSEGQINHLVPVYDQKDKVNKTVKIVQEGPGATIETTTLPPDKIFSEDLNRTLLLHPDGSEAQSRKVLNAIAQRRESRNSEAMSHKRNSIIAKHHAFQRMLQPVIVVIPFAKKLAAAMPADKPIVRRAIKQLFSVIEVVALLHQYQRERDGHDNIVATIEDYKIARQLLSKPLQESIGESEELCEFYERLEKTFGQGKQARTFEVGNVNALYSNQNLEIPDESTTRKRLAALVKAKCAVPVEKGGGRGKTAKWKLSRNPRASFLPDPDSLAD